LEIVAMFPEKYDIAANYLNISSWYEKITI
jgi:hypothetical protein